MQEAQQEMTSVKAALLSFAMLSAIVLCGLGIYSADAAGIAIARAWVATI